MRRGVFWATIAVAMIAVAGSASALEAPGRPAFKPPPPAGFTARHEVAPGLHVLSPADIERYRTIFALQDAERILRASPLHHGPPPGMGANLAT